MFLGLPEYIWNSIFQIAEILGVGLILGFFASHYQKRKETEYYLQGEIAKNRIDSYKNIIEIISGIYHSIAPPLEQQAFYKDLLEGMPFEMPQLSYPKFLNNENEFDDYYSSVSRLCVREHIFLDGKVEYRLNGYLSYLSEIKQLLDAFSDTMRLKNGISDEDRRMQTDLAYRCFGIALGNDFGKYYSKIDEIISDKVKHLKLGFRGKSLLLRLTKVNEYISTFLVGRMKDRGSLKAKVAESLFHLLFRNKLDYTLTSYPDFLIVLLMRIYYLDRYSVNEFNSLNDRTKKKLIHKFHKEYIAQLHVG